MLLGCTGGSEPEAVMNKQSSQTAPSELKKDANLSQPPKLSPPK
jgi:hypothetical protein